MDFAPVATGAYIALIVALVPVALAFPQWALHYILFLLFLGLGLRMVLERTGLYRLWISLETWLANRWNRKFLARRNAETDRKLRDEKYRKSRVRDPRLPKNW